MKLLAADALMIACAQGALFDRVHDDYLSKAVTPAK